MELKGFSESSTEEANILKAIVSGHQMPEACTVPVRRNVTFTCTSSGGSDLLWSLNVTGSMGYSRIISNTEGLKDRPGFSVSDESTVHHFAQYLCGKQPFTHRMP